MTDKHILGYDMVIAATISDALKAVGDTSIAIEERAAMYALLYGMKRKIDRALGTYIHKGPTAKSELAAHLATLPGEQLGPLYLGWEPFDVEWPVNEEGNWGDVGLQDELAVFALVAPDFIRHVPDHYEIRTAELGAGVHAGDPVARELHAACKERGWRREGGRRAALKVREVRPPGRAK